MCVWVWYGYLELLDTTTQPPAHSCSYSVFPGCCQSAADIADGRGLSIFSLPLSFSLLSTCSSVLFLPFQFSPAVPPACLPSSPFSPSSVPLHLPAASLILSYSESHVVPLPMPLALQFHVSLSSSSSVCLSLCLLLLYIPPFSTFLVDASASQSQSCTVEGSICSENAATVCRNGT